ncbi:hypothetical protein CTH_1957 [Carboxydocella thermautotrophica]|nr:hypothetical protein CTH_1957 [Carboxydocella thermautotrophica]
MTQHKFTNWVEVDVRTGKLLPNHRQLIGKTYFDRDGGIIEVVDICCLFPSTHVVVEKKATGKRWSVAAESIMELVD